MEHVKWKKRCLRLFERCVLKMTERHGYLVTLVHSGKLGFCTRGREMIW